MLKFRLHLKVTILIFLIIILYLVWWFIFLALHNTTIIIVSGKHRLTYLLTYCLLHSLFVTRVKLMILSFLIFHFLQCFLNWIVLVITQISNNLFIFIWNHFDGGLISIILRRVGLCCRFFEIYVFIAKFLKIV